MKSVFFCQTVSECISIFVWKLSWDGKKITSKTHYCFGNIFFYVPITKTFENILVNFCNFIERYWRFLKDWFLRIQQNGKIWSTRLLCADMIPTKAARDSPGLVDWKPSVCFTRKSPCQLSYFWRGDFHVPIHL